VRHRCLARSFRRFRFSFDAAQIEEWEQQHGPIEAGSGVLMRTDWSKRADRAAGRTFAHAMTKKMLHQEWNMGVDEAIEAEAQAQAICMATNDFHRAYRAFSAKEKPVFEGDSMEILQPAHSVPPRAYSTGIAAAGRMVFVSGMIGWDAKEK